ncbi:MAG: alanine racemase, partial [Candidatus Omnitrophica bacterium]|nr:alanine racemase [Candidatus Omnitrophota bacterium]
MKTNYRPTWAEIDLSAVRHNLVCIKKELTDKNTAVMAVVKANAYGHGLCQVSKTLVEEGIDYLGVATVDEAMTLRESGIKAPVLVLGSTLEEEAKAAVKNNITLTLCDERLLNILVRLARAMKVRPKVHVKVDTGMGRIGVWYTDAFDFIKKVHSAKEIELEGVYTHFSSAARDKLVTNTQITALGEVLDKMEEANISVKYKHAANSIAVVDWKKAHLNLVRTGILLYGVYPKESFRKNFNLKPVMNLKTKIVHLKDTPPGRSISYGRTYITEKHTKIATIPIGYADGYGRILSNKAEALVKGEYVRVVGKVTMDQTFLDVGSVSDVKIGDEVVLIGKQGKSEIQIEKVAKLAGTIPY